MLIRRLCVGCFATADPPQWDLACCCSWVFLAVWGRMCRHAGWSRCAAVGAHRPQRDCPELRESTALKGGRPSHGARCSAPTAAADLVQRGAAVGILEPQLHRPGAACQRVPDRLWGAAPLSMRTAAGQRVRVQSRKGLGQLCD